MSARSTRRGRASTHSLSVRARTRPPHRQAAWRAGEECLELVKEKVEVWKLEEFHGEEGVWRANRDGKAGEHISGAEAQTALEK